MANKTVSQVLARLTMCFPGLKFGVHGVFKQQIANYCKLPYKVIYMKTVQFLSSKMKY